MTQATTTRPTRRPAAVYRLYDASGALLYIGSAYDPARRYKAHRSKPWWSEVARCTEEWHPSRQAAFEAETDAISAERPTRNQISGPGAVLLPSPRPLEASAAPVLHSVHAYITELRAEAPEIRARKLTTLLNIVGQAVRTRRRQAVMEMHADGMTYRQIADACGISFGRVRQIIADDPGAEREPPPEPPAP